MSETDERPETQEEGWLPTIQDDIDRLRDMIQRNAPPETCHFATPRPGFEPCPPARRNSCILTITGYQPLSPACPLRLCCNEALIPYWLDRFGISLDDFLNGDCAPIAKDLMLSFLKRRCMATLLDFDLAKQNSPDAWRLWEGVLDRNWSRVNEINEARFCLWRDLTVRHKTPKDRRRVLRHFMNRNWDYLTPLARALKEGWAMPEPVPGDPLSWPSFALPLSPQELRAQARNQARLKRANCGPAGR
jgi:hypothetical protein